MSDMHHEAPGGELTADEVDALLTADEVDALRNELRRVKAELQQVKADLDSVSEERDGLINEMHDEPPGGYDLDSLLAYLDVWLDERAGDDAPPAPPPGWVMDPKGRMIRESVVREEDRLEDQTVRVIAAYWLDLAMQVYRFRAHTAADFAALHALLAEKYTARRVGMRGNTSYMSLDGRLKIVIQSQDRITFGPEIQIARTLIDGLIERWGVGTSDEVRALIAHAWPVDRPGQIHRESVLRLLRLDIDDPEWREAQRAIRNAVRVTGSKQYLRLQYRPSVDQDWSSIPIDLAADWKP